MIINKSRLGEMNATLWLFVAVLVALAVGIAGLVISLVHPASKGKRGRRGLRGRKGSTGATGVAGATGVGVGGATGVDGSTGPTGLLGPTGSSAAALGFAYATNPTSNIGPGSNVGWRDGGFIYPNQGIIPPAPGGSSFTITATGVYEYDYYVKSTEPMDIEFGLMANGSTLVTGSAFAESSTATGTVNVHAHGLAQFSGGDSITLQNIGASPVLVFMSPPIIDASLRLVQIA